MIRHIEIVGARDGQFFVRARAGNGEVLFITETFTHRTNARRAARKLRAQLKQYVEIANVEK